MTAVTANKQYPVLRMCVIATGWLLLAANFLIRKLPYTYDTPSRTYVAEAFTLLGFAILAWSPFGLFVLLLSWKTLALLNRVVMIVDLALAVSLVYYAF